MENGVELNGVMVDEKLYKKVNELLAECDRRDKKYEFLRVTADKDSHTALILVYDALAGEIIGKKIPTVHYFVYMVAFDKIYQDALGGYIIQEVLEHVGI